MKFCNVCGAQVTLRIPEGDSHERHVCGSCDTIHYLNPKIIVGCLPVWEEKILLCKRAIEPRYGKWTLPSGFMENGETAEEGAMRETEEEARAQVEIERIHTIYSLPQVGQVYLLYLSRLKNLEFSSGPESLEVRLFAEDEIPWNEIAFSAIKFCMKRYFENRDSQEVFSGSYVRS